MSTDIVALLNEALTHAGCGDKAAGELDRHAAIELDFADAPRIFIDKGERDHVVFYCCLSAHAEKLRASPLHAFLDTVAPKAEWAQNHAISLLEDNGDLYLTAVVADHCLQNGAVFSRALDGFYWRVKRLHEALQA